MRKSLLGAVCALGLMLGLNAVGEVATFKQLRTANQVPEQLANVKSARVVYAISGGTSKINVSAFMIRAMSSDKVRLDILTADGHIVCVRNGSDFWMSDSEKGVTVMGAEEAANFTEFIEFLPVPFYSASTLGAPVAAGEEGDYDDAQLIYNVKAKNGDTYEVAVDKETKDVCYISYDVEGEDAMSVTYGDYQDRNGIRIANRLDIVRPAARFSMKLVSVDWNLKLSESLFERNGNVADATVVSVDTKDAPVAKVETVVKADAAARNKAKAEKLEKKIRKLKLEIKFNEEKCAKMEHLLKIGHDDAMTLHAKGNEKDTRRYYWNGYCWNKDRDTGSRKARREAKKKAEELDEELEKAFKEYKTLNKKILKQRTKLSEAELELEKYKK